jgi:hypothetical protein
MFVNVMQILDKDTKPIFDKREYVRGFYKGGTNSPEAKRS